MPRRWSRVTYDPFRVATPDREGRLLLEPSFRAGRFDALAVDCPFVFSRNGRKGMTYVGWDGLGYQSALTWDDGDGWGPGELVLPRTGTGLRAVNAALTSIVRDNDLWSPGELTSIGGWYYGTFHAYPGEGYEVGPASIAFVRSRDLCTWEETGTVLRPGDGGPWSAGGLYKSWLMRHDGVFHLFYNAKDAGEWPWLEQTGHAISTDLVTWSHPTDQPVLQVGGDGAPDRWFASDPCVLRDGDVWLMFYFGLADDGHARELLAASTDLQSWTKVDGPLIDVGLTGSIDAAHAHKPSVITWQGRLEHYYCAVAPQVPVTVGDHVQPERRGITRASGMIPLSP
jgi:sucrose-6-phosphate hydrolase SacC (GH32 family)